MLEPDLYEYVRTDDDWKLEPHGQGKLEWHTPREFFDASPLVEFAKERWGSMVVRFARMPETWTDDQDTYWAIIEHVQEDGRMDPRWALVKIPEPDYEHFRETFKEYCESPQ